MAFSAVIEWLLQSSVTLLASWIEIQALLVSDDARSFDNTYGPEVVISPHEVIATDFVSGILAVLGMLGCSRDAEELQFRVPRVRGPTMPAAGSFIEWMMPVANCIFPTACAVSMP